MSPRTPARRTKAGSTTTPAGLTVAQLQPGDHLLEEAEAKTFYPHSTPGQTGDALLFESDGSRRTLADYWPTWVPRSHGTYMGHAERRGAGQSHGDGDGGVLDALTGGAAWLQGHWDRRVVDPIKRRWPVEDAPANRYSPAQAGQLAVFMPAYSVASSPPT